MKVLFVFPTRMEAEGMIGDFYQSEEKLFVHKKHKNLWLLITGAGIANTCLELGKMYHVPFDIVVQFGLAGSLKEEIAPGEIIRITEDVFADAGAEDGEDYIPADALQIGVQTVFTEKAIRPMPPAVETLLKASAITVNTVHGHEPSIEKIKKIYPRAVAESMEGCAFFMANAHRNNTLQIRAISNYVKKRNKLEWQILLALKNLTTLSDHIIHELFA